MAKTIINADTEGVKITGGDTNELELQTNGTAAITINATQQWVLANALPVASGGTGANTLTSEAVIIGNTTSAVKFVSPGTAGNVLTSNGTVWASTAPASPSPSSITNLSDGTVSAPIIAFASDTNTGIYRPAADTLGFVCNGTEDFRIDGNGQLWNTVNSEVGTDYTTLYKGYLCRAWVNFNGTGTVAIRASGNVSSITDNNTGNYRANFTTAMPDANYALVGAFFSTSGTSVRAVNGTSSGYSYSTTGATFQTTGTGGNIDGDIVNVAFFR